MQHSNDKKCMWERGADFSGSYGGQDGMFFELECVVEAASGEHCGAERPKVGEGDEDGIVHVGWQTLQRSGRHDSYESREDDNRPRSAGLPTMIGARHCMFARPRGLHLSFPGDCIGSTYKYSHRSVTAMILAEARSSSSQVRAAQDN